MLPPSRSAPRHFIVFLPGYMGSELRDRNSGKKVWTDFNSLPANPRDWEVWFFDLMDALRYPNDALESVGLIRDLQFQLPWVKLENYGHLLKALQSMGYRLNPRRYEETDRDLYTFSYDWRQDNRISAKQLAKAIEHWQSYHPGAEIWLLGHGSGGIVARWYIEFLEGKEFVKRLFLIASPWDGAPKALGMIKDGLETQWRRAFSQFDVNREESKRLIRSFPSSYQLVPYRQSFILDQHCNPIDPYKNNTWLDAKQERALLTQARRFNEQLGEKNSVDTICLYGRQRLTVSDATVHLEEGVWGDVTWWSTEMGDGTIPIRSAIHPQVTENLSFMAGHGDICGNESVVAALRWELIDRYRGGGRMALSSTQLQVTFEPDKHSYEPGETIQLWATVNQAPPESLPVHTARISVELTLYAPLPGNIGSNPRAIPGTNMRPDTEMEGRYKGSLVAPQIEGYYHLQARVAVMGQPTVWLSDLILVEAMFEH